MSLVVIPKFAAAEDDAPRTEWAVKTEVSMPAASSRDLSHLAIVLDVTALWGSEGSVSISTVLFVASPPGFPPFKSRGSSVQ